MGKEKNLEGALLAFCNPLLDISVIVDAEYLAKYAKIFTTPCLDTILKLMMQFWRPSHTCPSLQRSNKCRVPS